MGWPPGDCSTWNITVSRRKGPGRNPGLPPATMKHSYSPGRVRGSYHRERWGPGQRLTSDTASRDSAVPARARDETSTSPSEIRPQTYPQAEYARKGLLAPLSGVPSTFPQAPTTRFRDSEVWSKTFGRAPASPLHSDPLPAPADPSAGLLSRRRQSPRRQISTAPPSGLRESQPTRTATAPPFARTGNQTQPARRQARLAPPPPARSAGWPTHRPDHARGPHRPTRPAWTQQAGTPI